MNKIDYEGTMNNLLNKTITYKKEKKIQLTQKVQSAVNDMVLEWFDKEIIDAN